MNLKFHEIKKDKFSEFVKGLPFLIDEKFLYSLQNSKIISFKDKKPLGFYIFRKFKSQKAVFFENFLTTERDAKIIFNSCLDDFMKRNKDCTYFETNYLDPSFKEILIEKGFKEVLFSLFLNKDELKEVLQNEELKFKKLTIVEAREIFYEKALDNLLNESFQDEDKRNYVLIIKNDEKYGIYQYLKHNEDIFFIGIIMFEKNPTEYEIFSSIVDCLGREKFKIFSLVTRFNKVKEELEKIGFKTNGIKFLYKKN